MNQKVINIPDHRSVVEAEINQVIEAAIDEINHFLEKNSVTSDGFEIFPALKKVPSQLVFQYSNELMEKLDSLIVSKGWKSSIHDELNFSTIRALKLSILGFLWRMFEKMFGNSKRIGDSDANKVSLPRGIFVIPYLKISDFIASVRRKGKVDFRIEVKPLDVTKKKFFIGQIPKEGHLTAEEIDGLLRGADDISPEQR